MFMYPSTDCNSPTGALEAKSLGIGRGARTLVYHSGIQLHDHRRTDDLTQEDRGVFPFGGWGVLHIDVMV